MTLYIDDWVRLGKPKTKQWSQSRGYYYSLSGYGCSASRELAQPAAIREEYYQLKPGCRAQGEKAAGKNFIPGQGFAGAGVSGGAPIVPVSSPAPSPTFDVVIDDGDRMAGWQPMGDQIPGIQDWAERPAALAPTSSAAPMANVPFVYPSQGAPEGAFGYAKASSPSTIGGSISVPNAPAGGQVSPEWMMAFQEQAEVVSQSFALAEAMNILGGGGVGSLPTVPTQGTGVLGGVLGGYQTGGIGGAIVGGLGNYLSGQGLTGCPSGTILVNGQCQQAQGGISGTIAAILPGGSTGTIPAGQVGMEGMIGARAPTYPQRVEVNRCPTGMVMGKNGICYEKGMLPRKFRKRYVRKPAVSAADAAAIRKADSAKKRLVRLTKAAGAHASMTKPSRSSSRRRTTARGPGSGITVIDTE